MKPPHTFIKKLDRELARDIGFLFIASCFVLVELFDYHLYDAVLISPLMIAALMTGLYLFVQTLWVLIVVVDKVCQILHIKGRPIS